MTPFQYELAGCITPEIYAEAIPKCCSYQGYLGHFHGLGLCWGLDSAIRKGKQVNCSDCDLNKDNK